MPSIPNLPTSGSASTLLGGAAGAFSALVTIFKVNNRGIKAENQSLLQAEAIIEERHTDEMQITDHPTEFGATISDHAFKLPNTVILTYGWSQSPAIGEGTLSTIKSTFDTNGVQSQFFGTGKIDDIYARLIALQENRTVFAVQTGRRFYPTMLMKSVQVVTDANYENALMVRAECRQIILVDSVMVQELGANTQSDPSDTASTTNQGMKSLTPVSAS